MKRSLGQKIGIWVILILTSLALVVPSVAIVWNIFQAQETVQNITINPEDITITTATPQPENNTEEGETPVDSPESTDNQTESQTEVSQ